MVITVVLNVDTVWCDACNFVVFIVEIEIDRIFFRNGMEPGFGFLILCLPFLRYF